MPLRRWGVPVAFALVLAVSLARTLRWPNDFAEGQWLLNYAHGFMKRGLPGALLGPFVSPEDPASAERLVRAVSAGWLALWALAMLVLAVRLWRREGETRRAAVAVLVFLTSSSAVLAGHLNGYFDPILVLAAAGAVALALRGRERAAACLVAGTLLVHESFLVLGWPVVNLIAWRRAVAEADGAPPSPWAWARRAPWTLWLPPLVMLAIVLHQSLVLDGPVASEAMAAHIGRFPFVENGRDRMVPSTMFHPFLEYAGEQAPQFLRRITRPGYWLRVLVPLAVLLSYPWMRFRDARRGRQAFALFAAVGLLPLGLHAIAWDTERIWSYPFPVAFVALWGLAELGPDARGAASRWSPAAWLLAALALAVTVFTRVRLMDGELDGLGWPLRAVLYGLPIGFALWASRGPALEPPGPDGAAPGATSA